MTSKEDPKLISDKNTSLGAHLKFRKPADNDKPNVCPGGIGGADHGVMGRVQDYKNPVHRAGISKQLFYQKLNELCHYNVKAVTMAKVPRDSEDWINNPDEIQAVLKHTVVMTNLVAKD